MVLIITNQEDYHPTPVMPFFAEKGIKVFRLNTDFLLTDYQITFSNQPSPCLTMRNLVTGLTIQGDEIKSVWHRRPVEPSHCAVAEEPVRTHLLHEAKGLMDFLRYYFRDRFQLGSPWTERGASSKWLQLQVAQKLGIKTPAVIYSNHALAIQAFAQQYADLALKPIADISVLLEDAEYSFYTKKLSNEEVLNFAPEALQITYNHLEAYIPKLFELRVTTVGKQVFACKIDSQALQAGEGREDWREGYESGLAHEIFELPQAIESFCLAYLKEMNLNFGCFDFIVNPQNEYIFLECNPNGQWVWIEEATGLPISQAIAECLMRGEA